MELLFDGIMFQREKAGGVSRYFTEGISGLPPDWRPVVTGVEEFGRNVPRHPHLRLENPPRFRPWRVMQAYGRVCWKPRVARRADLLHPSYYYFTNHFAWPDFACPVVVTVYDLIYARFPAQMERADELVRAQREAVRRADRVVCISRHTEEDLLELLPEAAGKTTVIPLGSTFPVLDDPPPDAVFDEPIFLCVGARAGYKNFFFLLRAFARAASVRPRLRLHVVGGPLTPEEKWQIYFLGITDQVVSIVYPDEATLQECYRRSVALLYPSLYEGFGIPPLEAMACGTVAVTGNRSSLPEVVGDGGILLDPLDEAAWTDCILKLSRPFPERASLLGRGRAQAGRFTWSECARSHVEIYRSLAGGPPP